MAHTTTLRSSGLLVALALTLAVGSVATAPPAAAASEARVVILYGDSLAWESQAHFVAAVELGTDATALGRSFGGTAICDYLDIMREDSAMLRPAAVVLEFSGNRFTTCMHHPDGEVMGDGDAYMKYLADVREAVRIFTERGHACVPGRRTREPAGSRLVPARASIERHVLLGRAREPTRDGDLHRRGYSGATGD